MTVEVDAIVAVHKAANAPGIVTDIDTPGVHAKRSWHYSTVDPWIGKKVTGSKTGGGTAVDFGGKRGRPLGAADAMTVYKTFEPYGKAGQLMELFCGQAEWCVYQGRFMPWAAVPSAARIAIRDAHRNHQHIAVRPGTILVPLQREETRYMPDVIPNPVDAVSIPGVPGGVWTVARDGGVAATPVGQVPFFGSFPGLKPEYRQGPLRYFIAIEAAGLRPEDGYTLHANDGSAYTFNGGMAHMLS